MNGRRKEERGGDGSYGIEVRKGKGREREKGSVPGSFSQMLAPDLN